MARKNLLTTSSSRRAVLGVGAAGLATTFLTGKIVQGQVTTTPTATEGPFLEDEMLGRSNIIEGEVGLALYLNVSISQLTSGVARPLPNAQVDIWHGNGLGYYSDEPAGMGNPNTLGMKYLRGFHVTNSRGLVRFTTIYPAYYDGRTTHIHVRVRTYTGTTTTRNVVTQFFFDDAVSDQVYSSFAPYNTKGARSTRNNNDMVYNEQAGGTAKGNSLMLRLARNGISAAIASFNMVVT